MYLVQRWQDLSFCISLKGHLCRESLQEEKTEVTFDFISSI